MSTYSAPPRVVMVGKQKNSRDYAELCGLISEIRPAQIPRDFLYKVIITTYSSRQHEVKGAQLSGGVDYENIEKYVTDLGIKLTDVALVEIVIDLEKTQQALNHDVKVALDDILRDC